VTDPGLTASGRLLVFAGMSEGVGTTSRMLVEGHRLRAAGVDVVAAVVATHGRTEVARLLEGLEVLGELSVTYRGVTIEELDALALIDRRPRVALVDELWHENATGIGRPARWGDVADIRDAGIDVISTVDLGRLESLADAVETITGSPIHERLPDAVLDLADEVVLVDVDVASLRRRIEDGLVYPLDRARVALDRSLTNANLATLRELALRYMAQRAERELERIGGLEVVPGPRAGPVLVLLEPGVAGRHAVRRAAVLASLLRVGLMALVPGQRMAGELHRSGDSPTARENLTYATDLGATSAHLAGSDVVVAIVESARNRRSGHLVLGQRSVSDGWRPWATPLVGRLLRADPGLEVHLAAELAAQPVAPRGG
jgi:two-component system sensor histidine kinase KdpD